MNYFAISVIVMQLLAAIQYARQSLWLEAGLWATYGVGNVLLVLLAMKRLQ